MRQEGTPLACSVHAQVSCAVNLQTDANVVVNHVVAIVVDVIPEK